MAASCTAGLSLFDTENRYNGGLVEELRTSIMPKSAAQPSISYKGECCM
jgi:hypothetical protein